MNKNQKAFRSLHNVLSNSVFAIEPQAAENLYPLAKKFLQGDFSVFQNIQNEEKEEPFSVIEKNASVVIVSFSGVMLKSDGLCYSGVESFANLIKKLDAHSEVDAILIKLDTPGGQFDGTGSLAKVIANCSKPTISLIDDGMMCSAGYYAGSHAQEVWASKATDRVGSIGTMISIQNLDKKYEKEGIEINHIYATKSKDKNKDFHEAQKGNFEPIINGMLNPLNDEFLNAVKSMRPNIKEECLTGKVFLAKDAINLGMIDRIGTQDEAVAYLAKKSKSLIKSSSNQPQNKTIMSKGSFLNFFFPEAKSEEEAEKQFNEKIESSEKWTALVAENTAFKAEKESLTAKVTALETQVSTLTAQNEALVKENESYSNIAGAAHTKPIQKEIERTVDLDAEPTNVEVLRNSKFAEKSRKFRGEE